MNKLDLIDILAKDGELTLPKAYDIVNKVFHTMAEALVAGDRIEIRGFGSFTVRNYNGYVGRNPKTGETTTVTPKKLPFFKVGKELAEGVNRGPAEE
jgi:integration host factor subunit beta